MVSTAQGTGQQLEQTLTVEDSVLPSPQEIEKYKNLDPRFVDLFIELTKNEQLSRHNKEKEGLDIIKTEQSNDFNINKRGMNYAFGTVILFVALAAFALYLDHPWFAGVSGFLSLSAVISMFLGKPEDDADEEENTDDTEGADSDAVEIIEDAAEP